MEDDEAAVLCYGYDDTNDEWIPILVDATGLVEVSS